MAEPLLLTYNLNIFTAGAIHALCQAQGIRVREVKRDEYTLPIGALAGLPVHASASVPTQSPFNDEMLVMCHMLSDQLDGFLEGLRDRGIPRVALKAVLTPTNIAWSSHQLRDELAREHEAVQRRSQKS